MILTISYEGLFYVAFSALLSLPVFGWSMLFAPHPEENTLNSTQKANGSAAKAEIEIKLLYSHSGG